MCFISVSYFIRWDDALNQPGLILRRGVSDNHPWTFVSSLPARPCWRRPALPLLAGEHGQVSVRQHRLFTTACRCSQGMSLIHWAGETDFVPGVDGTCPAATNDLGRGTVQSLQCSSSIFPAVSFGRYSCFDGEMLRGWRANHAGEVMCTVTVFLY